MANHILINKKIDSYDKDIAISGDKSISIRCVLLASQAIGKSKIYNLLESEDVLNSLKTIDKLGIKFKKKKNYHEISGFGLSGYKIKKNTVINAGNSGTLARLILGLLIDANKKIKLIGDKSLSKRDFKRISDPLKLFGANIFLKKKGLPLEILGTEFPRPINYFEKIGSAQCKSAVMLAAIKTPGKTKIFARKSRNHTELLFKNLKIPITVLKKKEIDVIEIDGLKNFKSFEYNVPGDISSSSFFIVLTILTKNSKLKIRNVNVNDTRTGIISILKRMNANILFKNKRNYKGEKIADIHIKFSKNLKSINCPKKYNSSAIDEFLVIFLVAAKSKGVSIFKNLGELNKKESPRLNIAVAILKKIGVKVIKKDNDLKIFGNPNLNLKKTYVIEKFRKDHRIFMMSCIAALAFGGKWKINNKDSINSSFPDFLKKLNEIGCNFT